MFTFANCTLRTIVTCYCRRLFLFSSQDLLLIIVPLQQLAGLVTIRISPKRKSFPSPNCKSIYKPCKSLITQPLLCLYFCSGHFASTYFKAKLYLPYLPYLQNECPLKKQRRPPSHLRLTYSTSN